MAGFEGLTRPFCPDWEGLVSVIRREGTPRRVFHMELFQDWEIIEAIAERFDLAKDLDRNDPDYSRHYGLAVRRFCGFDYVTAAPTMDVPMFRHGVEDTASAGRTGQERPA